MSREEFLNDEVTVTRKEMADVCSSTIATIHRAMEKKAMREDPSMLRTVHLMDELLMHFSAELLCRLFDDDDDDLDDDDRLEITGGN